MRSQLGKPSRTVAKFALEEARRRGDNRIGTEHLMLGLVADPSLPSARALGFDLAAGRDALETMDRDALASVGIDVSDAESTGTDAVRSRGRVRFTSGAKRVWEQTVKASTADRKRMSGDVYILLALLDAHTPDPSAEMLTRLHVDASAVRSRLPQG